MTGAKEQQDRIDDNWRKIDRNLRIATINIIVAMCLFVAAAIVTLWGAVR